MHKFGYLDRINGLDHLPYWKKSPCKNITASEGSFFPPRDITKSDIVKIYDKDLCRIIPLEYSGSTNKDGEKILENRSMNEKYSLFIYCTNLCRH